MADKKPLLAMLGFGQARKAGEALADREKQLDRQIADAEATQKKKKLSEQLGIKTDP